MALIHISESKHTVQNSLKKARAIKKLKPDIVIFEYPKDSEPGIYYNKFSPNKKPLVKFNKVKQGLTKGARKHPWLAGDVKIFEEIENLWSSGKQVLLFNMDGPRELTVLCDKIVKSQNRFHFDVWNYCREQYMIKTIKQVRAKHPKAKIIVLCHNSHWESIKFLLSNPSKQAIKKYYFARHKHPDFSLKDGEVLRKYLSRLN